MTKADLVERVTATISQTAGPMISKKDCARVVDAFLDAIKDALKEQRNIEVRGFGTFKIRQRKTRMARNPRTGSPVEVAARPVPVFKPSKELRAMVAGGEGLIQKGLLALALLAAVAFLPRLIGKLRRKPMLDVPELKRRLDAGEDMLVLDVRPLDGYTGDLGHIAGVTHIPLNELEQRIHELDAYQEKPIVTICRTDRMSSTAAQLLAQKGFSNVQVARQGMTDWNKNGYPVER